MESIRSIFFAVVAVFLAVVTTAPFTAPAQENEPEVILTLEGNYIGQVQFVFTGDTILYEPRTIAPIYPAPVDVTVNGKPWKGPDQPFKLGFTPDFEDEIPRRARVVAPDPPADARHHERADRAGPQASGTFRTANRTTSGTTEETSSLMRLQKHT